MVFLLFKMIMIGDAHISGFQGIKDPNFLRGMMVRAGMKVLLNVGFLLIYLVGYGAIIVIADEDVKKWKDAIFFRLHGKIDGLWKTIQVVQENI